MKATPKFAVIGHARHGKDTVCELMRDRYGLSFTSSSLFCAEKVVFPRYRSWAMGNSEPLVDKHMRWPATDPSWITAEQCFEERSKWRAMWFDLIADYNRPDPATLARAITDEHDIYAGIRSTREFHAAVNEGLFDFVIWVDRSSRLPDEPADSMQLKPWMATYVIDNNGDLDDLKREVDRLLMFRLGLVPKEGSDD